MKRFLPLFFLFACEPLDVTPGDPAYESGHLGNGGFAFSCDDSVACNQYAAADKFPDAVALGSKFSVRYLPKDYKSTGTLSAVGTEQLSTLGAGTFTATGTGIATIVVKDSGGTMLEWVELPVRKPDAIVVTDPQSSGAPISKVTLEQGDYYYGAKELRVFASYQSTQLAGELNYEWKSSDPDTVFVQSASQGKVYLSAKKEGTTTLTVEGGTFTQSIEVEVR